MRYDQSWRGLGASSTIRDAPVGLTVAARDAASGAIPAVARLRRYHAWGSGREGLSGEWNGRGRVKRGFVHPLDVAAHTGTDAIGPRRRAGSGHHVSRGSRAVVGRLSRSHRRVRSGICDGHVRERDVHVRSAVYPILHLPYARPARAVEWISLHCARTDSLELWRFRACSRRKGCLPRRTPGSTCTFYGTPDFLHS